MSALRVAKCRELLKLGGRRSFCVWRIQRNAFCSQSKLRVSEGPSAGEESEWLRRVVYSSYLQQWGRLNEPRSAKKAFERMDKENERLVKTWTTLPVVASMFLNPEEPQKSSGSEVSSSSPSSFQFPYKVTTSYEKVDRQTNDVRDGSFESKIVSEGEKLEKLGIDVESLLKKTMDEDGEDANRIVFQEMGTPDPKIKSSGIPCGGCGAHLHCQDTSVPGYMPSERFKLLNDNDLRGEICLRCYSLKEYNTALNVNVSPEDYPELLKVIRGKFALVVLMIDLTDFPCSIWPGIVDIIGEKRPVILVGNKVDLLPRDSDRYLDHVKKCMISVAEEVGLTKARIFDTVLVSATTGFGVENLISSIYHWGMKGDVYIMGCTNVGKSSLFNMLIQSDMCKDKVVDLVQRATVSQWPGTTLNLLQFPVQRADVGRLVERNMRLTHEAQSRKQEKKELNMMLRLTKDPQYGTLMGYVGRTFLSGEKSEAVKNPERINDPYGLSAKHAAVEPLRGQWNPDEPYLRGHRCFDTPGVVHENQILDKLTLPELMKTLPKKLITPRTYFIKQGMSFFIGGLARIDHVEGYKPIRYTLFASDELPVTISLTEHADDVYSKGFGTPVFGVPEGTQARLDEFPELLPNEFILNGFGHKYSCADLVFSSIGWVGVTIGDKQSSVLKVWTPNGKGIFCRLPALLPYSVNMKGQRIRDTPAYERHRIFIPNKLV